MKHLIGLQNFIQLIKQCKNEEILQALIEFFLTKEEQLNFSTRYFIIKELLNQNTTQRQIAKNLKVSIAKITRGSNELKRSSKDLLAYLKKHLR